MKVCGSLLDVGRSDNLKCLFNYTHHVFFIYIVFNDDFIISNARMPDIANNITNITT